MNNKVDLDLDQFEETTKIKLKGEIIEIESPDLRDFMNMQKIVKEWQGVDTTNLDEKQANEMIERMEEAIYRCVPAVKEKRMGINQLMALVQFIIQSGVPKQTQELEKRGIKLDTTQKKTTSATAK